MSNQEEGGSLCHPGKGLLQVTFGVNDKRKIPNES